MFKNKTAIGRNNVCGEKIRELRLGSESKMSQRMLAEKLQLMGIDVDKNAIQRIESGDRFVTDIELIALRAVFEVTYTELLEYGREHGTDKESDSGKSNN